MKYVAGKQFTKSYIRIGCFYLFLVFFHSQCLLSGPLYLYVLSPGRSLWPASLGHLYPVTSSTTHALYSIKALAFHNILVRWSTLVIIPAVTIYSVPCWQALILVTCTSGSPVFWPGWPLFSLLFLKPRHYRSCQVIFIFVALDNVC